MRKLKILLLAVAAIILGSGGAFAATSSVNGSRIIVNGSPFFPFGFFANVGNPMRDLQAVGSGGFNTTYCNNICDSAYYNLAQQLGTFVISDIWWPDPQSTVLSSRDKPALLGYYVADDINYNGSCQTPRYTPEELAARSALIKSYDLVPPHVTTGAVVLAPYAGCVVAPYMGKVDFLQGYNYPIASWVPEADALELNTQAVKSMVVAANGQWPVVAIGQAFAWPDWRLPTPTEALNMNYASLAVGANGVMMYTVSDPNGYYLPDASPALWSEYVQEAAEVRALAPVLLNGTRSVLTTQPNIYATLWTYGYRMNMLVIVVNTNRTTGQYVDLTLPSRKSIHPQFARLPGTLTQNGCQLSGTVPPESVQIYASF